MYNCAIQKDNNNKSVEHCNKLAAIKLYEKLTENSSLDLNGHSCLMSGFSVWNSEESLNIEYVVRISHWVNLSGVGFVLCDFKTLAVDLVMWFQEC